MLYWICPECGHECSPAVRECPTCAASEAAQAAPVPTAAFQTEASNQLLSLAQNFEAPATATALAPAAPRPPATSTNGHESSRVSALAVEEEVVAPERKEPEPSRKLVPLNKNSVRPARPGEFVSLPLSPSPVPAKLSAPAFAPTVPAENGELTLERGGWRPMGEVSFRPVQADGMTVASPSIEPLPSRRRSVAFVRAPLQAPSSGGIAIGRLAPLDPALSPVNSKSKSTLPTFPAR